MQGVATRTGRFHTVPIHVTPTEMARMAGLERGEVLEACRRYSIPVLHGRIDKSLFMLSMREATRMGSVQPGH